MSKEYIRLSQKLNDKYYQMIPASESPYKYIKDKTKPQFVSMIKYPEDVYQEWQKTKTLAGATGGKTNKIWVDFDDHEDKTLINAFKDGAICVKDLLDLGISEDSIQISFSGNKGIGIIVNTSHNEYTIEQVKAFCFDMWSELKTFDRKMYDHQRIFRLNYTVNEKTNLYKIPITYEELVEANIEAIKENAKVSPSQEEIEDVQAYYKVSDFRIPTEYLNIAPIKISSPVDHEKSLDSLVKPKFLSNCRWSLQNGFFEEGQRSSALLCLASTYKNLGFSEEIVYRMLKGVAEKQSKRTGQDRFPDTDIYNNIILQVYSDRWKNGQYSCKQEGNFLFDYCNELGDHSCSHTKSSSDNPHTMLEISPVFKHFVTNIEKNTVKTGLPTIDKDVVITTGTNLIFLGAPGSGKSSFALNVLNNTSKAGIISVFASLDMHPNRMFEKVMYKISGLKREQLYQVFKENKEGPLLEKLKAEFGNVYFFNKSSPSIEDIKGYILDVQEETGQKVKLLMLDYFERVTSDMNDDTAASKRVAGGLQDLVNDLDIALVNLVQPNKMAISGGPDSPIYDYTKIKGSSFVYQSARIIMSCWRPFYHPQDFKNDHYMQMAVLKNDLGELKEFAFNWNGPRGEISEMEDFQKDEFYRLLKEKEANNSDDDEGGWN